MNFLWPTWGRGVNLEHGQSWTEQNYTINCQPLPFFPLLQGGYWKFWFKCVKLLTSTIPVWIHPFLNVNLLASGLLRYPSITCGPLKHNSPSAPGPNSTPVSRSTTWEVMKKIQYSQKVGYLCWRYNLNSNRFLGSLYKLLSGTH